MLCAVSNLINTYLYAKCYKMYRCINDQLIKFRVTYEVQPKLQYIRVHNPDEVNLNDNVIIRLDMFTQ